MAYEPQEGTWTLTAPDGRQWTGASGLLAAAAEQKERIPAAVQLKRIFAELEPTEDEKDAARYRWLREQARLGTFGGVVTDAAIDAAMAETPNELGNRLPATGAAKQGEEG